MKKPTVDDIIPEWWNYCVCDGERDLNMLVVIAIQKTDEYWMKKTKKKGKSFGVNISPKEFWGRCLKRFDEEFRGLE